MALTALGVLCVGWLIAAEKGAPQRPYAPDEHTLFLHHFDGDTGNHGLEPNLARGVKEAYRPAPETSRFVQGKFGKALWFDNGGPGVSFQAAKNYDPAAGTIEFFVRPAFPGASVGGASGFGLFFETHGGSPEPKGRVALGRGDFNSARTGATPSDFFGDLLDGQLGLRASVAHWKADEWHHVALMWDKDTARLVLDGVRVAEGKHTGLGPVDTFAVGAGGFAAMDELRISDILRAELEVGNKVTAPTPFKPLSESKPLPPQPLPALPKPSPRPPVVKITPGAPHLFVDDFLIQSQSNLFRRLGQVRKYEKNPVITPDKPWEEVAAFPFSGGAYRLADGHWAMWYQTYRRWLSGGERTSACYATSQDGLTWTKPALNLFKVADTTANNVVLATGFDNITVLHDAYDPDATRRYKAGVYTGGDQGAGVYGYTSPDGLHWTRMPKALIPQAGDRSSIWHDTLRKKYIVFTRYAPIYRGRYIFRAESDDFVTWSTPELILHYSAIDQAHGIQHYGANGFAYGDMYLGFLEMFHVPYRRLDTELICSRDGRAWSRVCEGEVFLPNGPEGSFDWFWAFPAGTPPIRVGDELWFYYAGRMHPHGAPPPPIHPGGKPGEAPRHAYWSATGLAKLRADGFAAMDASGIEGRLVTVPIQFDRGSKLLINADADNFPPGSSWLKVALLAEDMSTLPGFGVDDFDTLTADRVSHIAHWKAGSNIASLARKPIRLDFRLVNTRLYSFGVGE